MSANWIVPPYANGTIDHYIVTCNNLTVYVYVESNTSHPYVFLNLTHGIEYTCTVRAHSAAGYGPPSLPSSGILGQYGKLVRAF